MRRLVLTIALLAFLLTGTAQAFWSSGGGGSAGGATGPAGPTGATGPAGPAASACTNSTTPVSSGSGCNFTVLTSAQIKALDLTPVTLLTTPGSNKAIIITSVLLQGKPGTLQYLPEQSGTVILTYNTFAAPNEILSYADGSKPVISSTIGSPQSSFLPAMLLAAGSANGWLGASLVSNAVASTLFANQPVILVTDPTHSVFNAGPITSVTVANGGAGYAVNDTFTIDAGQNLMDSGDATGHVTAAPGGVVSTVAINAAGTSYSITTANANTGPYTTAHTSGAGNDALTLNVTGATVGNGTAVIYLWYNIVTLQ